MINHNGGKKSCRFSDLLRSIVSKFESLKYMFSAPYKFFFAFCYPSYHLLLIVDDTFDSKK